MKRTGEQENNMKTVFIILGILAVALLTFFAIGIVAIAWADRKSVV